MVIYLFIYIRSLYAKKCKIIRAQNCGKTKHVEVKPQHFLRLADRGLEDKY